MSRTYTKVEQLAAEMPLSSIDTRNCLRWRLRTSSTSRKRNSASKYRCKYLSCFW